MWVVNRNDIQMTEKDYGIQLPITVSGIQFGVSDKIQFTIKSRTSGSKILTKYFSTVVDNTINLELTQADTALLPPGEYLYSLDWYQADTFMCNIIPTATFKVVKKA